VVEAGSVSEDAAAVAINLLANASDVDTSDVLSVAQGQGNTVTASVVSGTWAAPIAFTVSGNTLNIDPAQFAGLRTGQSLDIVFDYTVTDGTKGDDVAASAHITITGANDAPANIALSSNHVMENSLAGTVIGQLSAVNPDIGETISYQIVSNPSGFFALNGTNLVVAAGATLDYETTTSYSIDVMATDSSGLSTTKTLVIAVDNQLGVTISGSSGNDVFNATTGTPRPTEEGDTISGNNGNDTLDGLGGNDNIEGGSGLDTLLGGAGNDTLNGGRDADNVQGGAGNDRIVIVQDEGLNDVFNGGDGTDTLVASGAKGLTLNGFNATASSIEVWEGNGQGVVGTAAGQTFDFSGITAVTGSGIGLVDAGDGADTLIGSNLADNFRGGAASDTLRGNGGNDILDGGAGNDVINGGIGNDTLTGGSNNDTFVFNKPATGTGVDNITDFVSGADKIGLVAADFGLSAGPLAAGDFVVGAAANAAHQQFIYNAATKTLSWDADGTGGQAAVALTTFSTAVNLTLNDLVLV
jgi:Ca2+-binding RTX toxin-like protein